MLVFRHQKKLYRTCFKMRLTESVSFILPVLQYVPFDIKRVFGLVS